MASATKTYPTRLAEILDSEGRRQTWLASKTGISSSVLSNYVNGLHVPDDRKAAIADALGRTVEDVFGEVQI